MILARAPFRISLGGGGTDLPSYYRRHGGFILSGAIDRYVYISLNQPAADDEIVLKYSRSERVRRVDEIQHDLVRPALELMRVHGNVEISSMADIRDGTGMGSSGSFLVSLLTALHEMKRERVGTAQLAEEACHIELEIARHPVGKQDHYMAAFGGLTCLDIRQDGTVYVDTPEISLTTTEELRSHLLLYFTGISRNWRMILEQQVADTEREDPTVIDSLHRIKDIGYKIRETLEIGDIERFGRCLDEHWQAKKRRSGDISNPRVDRCYEKAMECGAYGGKLIGPGGDGFLMLCCPGRARHAVREEMRAEGLREMRFDWDFQGAKVLLNI